MTGCKVLNIFGKVWLHIAQNKVSPFNLFHVPNVHSLTHSLTHKHTQTRNPDMYGLVELVTKAGVLAANAVVDGDAGGTADVVVVAAA